MVRAQESVMAKNTMYIDFGGIGGFGSINYSRQFYSIQKFDFEGHIGISTSKFKDFHAKFNPQIIIPFGLHTTFGNKHCIEFGIGSTYVNSVRANNNLDSERFYTLNGNTTIGYKFRKKEGGLFFRAFYAPIFEEFKNIKHWGGLSFGYAF